LIQLKSTNNLYILGTVPLICISMIGAILLSETSWLELLFALIGIVLIVFIVRKSLFLPRKKEVYSDLQPFNLELPTPYNVQLYTSDNMMKYDFLNRWVEIISPLKFQSDMPVMIAINPKILSDETESFTKIAITREIENYKNKSQIKTILGLAVPVLLVIVLTEMYFLFDLDIFGWINPNVFTFFAPFVCVLLFVFVVITWNTNVSKQDYKVDKQLLKYFDKTHIIQYIQRNEELAFHGQKANRRAVQNHYVDERVLRLKQ